MSLFGGVLIKGLQCVLKLSTIQNAHTHILAILVYIIIRVFFRKVYTNFLQQKYPILICTSVHKYQREVAIIIIILEVFISTKKWYHARTNVNNNECGTSYAKGMVVVEQI